MKHKYKGKGALLLVTVAALKGKEDAVGAKLLKVFEFLREKLQEFGLVASGWEWDKGSEALFYFVAKKKELPEFKIRMGPPLKMKEFVADFKKKNKNTFEEKGRVMAKVKVETPKLKDFVNALVKEEYVMGRVGKVKKVEVV